MEQLEISRRAAEAASSNLVGPGWFYVANGAVWTAAFTITVLTGWFWFLLAGVAVGTTLISSARTRVTGVKRSERWQIGLSNRAVVVVVIFVVLCIVLMAGGIVAYEFVKQAWAAWAAGAAIGALMGLGEWRLDSMLRNAMRGRQ